MMPVVAFAYRFTVHAATECCPSEIFLGRNLRLPVDIVTGKRPEGTNYPFNNFTKGSISYGATFAESYGERFKSILNMSRAPHFTNNSNLMIVSLFLTLEDA